MIIRARHLFCISYTFCFISFNFYLKGQDLPGNSLPGASTPVVPKVGEVPKWNLLKRKWIRLWSRS